METKSNEITNNSKELKDNNNIKENEKEMNNELNEEKEEKDNIEEKENSIILSPINKNNKENIIPENAKYGIDKDGNPVEITELNKNELIAIIIQKENKDNYLVDFQGNILSKTEDDYYCYKNGEELIIIKDFDVKHPELRIYGHRKINFEEIKKNFDNSINNIIKSNKNKNSSFLLNDDKEKIIKNINTNISNIEEKEMTNLTNNTFAKNKSVILDEKNNNINIDKNEFKNQMNIWRKRYGKNNELLDDNKKEKPVRKYSYNKRNNMNNSTSIIREKNELINRTDSILRMASNKKNKNKMNHSAKDIKCLLYNRNYSYVNIKENNYRKMKTKEKEKNKRKKILEDINNKYNNYTTDININIYNEEEKNKRINILKDIKEKYNNKINNIKEESKNEEIKKEIIDDYIYSNLKKINNIKKNKKMKCSVLKTEVNQIISNFNKKQKNRGISYKNEYTYDEIPLNKKGEQLFFEYGNDENDLMFKKIKLIPSKIKKNKIEIYTNNNSIKLDTFTNNNYYRKIKHNKY